jgi:hypothetical protein
VIVGRKRSYGGFKYASFLWVKEVSGLLYLEVECYEEICLRVGKL